MSKHSDLRKPIQEYLNDSHDLIDSQRSEIKELKTRNNVLRGLLAKGDKLLQACCFTELEHQSVRDDIHNVCKYLAIVEPKGVTE